MSSQIPMRNLGGERERTRRCAQIARLWNDSDFMFVWASVYQAWREFGRSVGGLDQNPGACWLNFRWPRRMVGDASNIHNGLGQIRARSNQSWCAFHARSTKVRGALTTFELCPPNMLEFRLRSEKLRQAWKSASKLGVLWDQRVPAPTCKQSSEAVNEQSQRKA